MIQLADNIASFLVWIVMFAIVIGWFMKNEPRWYFWSKISLLASLGALYAIIAYGGKGNWWLVALIFFMVAFNVILKLPAKDKKENRNAE